MTVDIASGDEAPRPISIGGDDAARLLRAHSCVQVLGAFHPLEIANAKANLDSVYDQIDALPDDLKPRSARLHARLEPETFGAYGPVVIDWIEAFVRASPIIRVIETRLGGTAEAEHRTVRVRRHTPDRPASFVPWHQDLAFLGTDRLWLNCWVPLTACGPDAPALDLIPFQSPYYFATDMDSDPGGYGMGGIPTADLESAFGADAAWTPKMRVGDCLVFDNTCPHRTSLRSTNQRPRMSFEIRFSRVGAVLG